MKFLSVLCVVLFLYNGDCLNPIYSPGNSYENLRNDQFNNQNNYEINRNNQKQTIIEAPSIIKPINRWPDTYYRRGIGLPRQNISPQYINRKEVYSNIQPINREQLLLPETLETTKIGGTIEPVSQEILTRINEKTPTGESVPINKLLLENKFFKPEEDIKLELPGVSDEYIKKLINPQTAADLTLLRFIDIPSKLSPENNFGVNSASYQNPSAEIVYKLNQALPFEINKQEFLNAEQDRADTRNIITNARQIQDIYKTTHPESSYTVIYPDGRIEYVDQIDGIIAKHPHYVLIKPDDIKKHIQNPNIYSQLPPTVNNYPLRQPLSDLKASKLDKLNDEESYVNSGIENDQTLTPIGNDEKSTDKNNILVSNDTNLEAVSFHISNDETANQTDENKEINIKEVPAIKINLSNYVSNVNINDAVLQNDNTSNIAEVVTPQKENIVMNTLQSDDDIIETNNDNVFFDVLPNSSHVEDTIIDTIIDSNDTERESLKSHNDNNRENIDDDLKYIASRETSTSESSLKTNKIFPENANAEIKGNSTNLLVDLYTPVDNNTNEFNTTVQPNNENISKIINNDLLDMDDLPSESSSVNDSNSKNLEETAITVSPILNFNESSEYPDGNTYTSESTSIDDADATDESGESNLVEYNDMPAKENTEEKSPFLFEPNEGFWSEIMNSTNNVFYFLFVPPKPNIKETKTTIYPNGTTITEVTETIVDNDEPKKIQSTTVTSKDDNDISENIS